MVTQISTTTGQQLKLPPSVLPDLSWAWHGILILAASFPVHTFDVAFLFTNQQENPYLELCSAQLPMGRYQLPQVVQPHS